MSEAVVVVGAGQMGAGIAQVAAAAGYDVTLSDVSAGQLERARDGIARSLDKLVEKGRVERATADAAVELQARALADERLVLAQRCAGVVGPPVLPHDRRVDGSPGRAVPDHERLGLVGDAERCHVARRGTGCGQRVRDRPLRG